MTIACGWKFVLGKISCAIWANLIKEGRRVTKTNNKSNGFSPASIFEDFL